MNAGILAPGYAPPQMPAPLLGQPQPVPTPYGRRGDPFWDNVSLLLPMNGQHGSTSIFDLSKNANRVTASNGAAITTQQARFGQALNLDGSNDLLTVPNAAWLNPGGSNFTLEVWARPTATNGLRLVHVKRPSVGVTNIAMGINSGAWTFWASSNGSTWDIVNGVAFGTPLVNVWQHVAVVRVGSSFAGYLNGARTALSTSTLAVLENTSSLSIGADLNGTNAFAGQLSDYRLTVGAGRYSSAFPAPTAPFPIGYQ